mmetsp:Transcript_2409/g.2015  ORF Transcript_2409/g.2015 Transcript_2409/m.2015 type:complete len:127 (+) Transcript_2409:219-599(+)
MREQANRDINNMQHEYNIILDKEIKRKGVIIKQALFGNLNRKKDNNNELEGPYINVTIPLRRHFDDDDDIEPPLPPLSSISLVLLVVVLSILLFSLLLTIFFFFVRCNVSSSSSRCILLLINTLSG